jgi:hypothetical protein
MMPTRNTHSPALLRAIKRKAAARGKWLIVDLQLSPSICHAAKDAIDYLRVSELISFW